MKKIWCVGFFIGILVLFFVFMFMFFIGDDFTGNLIWSPGASGNCVDSEILTLWDNVFIEGSGGVVILKDYVAPEGDCNAYIAYKNNSDGEFWVLYGDFYESFWGSSVDLYSSDKKILDFMNLHVVYGNVSSDFLENFGEQTNVSLVCGLVLGIGDGDVADWSVLNESVVKSRFNELYEFVDVSGVSFGSDASMFDYSESDDFEWDFSSIDIVCRKDKAFFSGEYWDYNYDHDFFVEFSGNIGGFVFLINSSWNFAFDYGDYFNVSDNVSVEFNPLESDNENGALVNFTFDGSDVSFAPAAGFSGWCSFEIVAKSGADDVVSNNFTVNITRYNEAPVLLEPIPDIYIDSGDNTVDLDYYFSDDDALSYGVSGVSSISGVSVSFSGPIMSVSVDSNFSDYTRFKVYAFDGITSIFSDYVYVFLEGGNNNLNDNNVGLNASVDDGVSVGIDNVSGGNNSNVFYKRKGNGWIYWLVGFVVIGVFIVVVIGVVVYFFVIKKKNISNSGDEVISSAVVSPTDNYIKKLSLG